MTAGPTLDIRFFVPGIPVPKGSHEAFVRAVGKCKKCKPGKPCMAGNCVNGVIVRAIVADEQGAELKAWQQMTHYKAISARNSAGHRLVKAPGSVDVSMVFVIPRPKGHWTASGLLTKEGRDRPNPSVKPDNDKLQRAISDGLTGALVEDDAQLVIGRAAKIYASWKGDVGVVVRARQFTSYDAWVLNEMQHAGVRWESPNQRDLW